MYRFKFEKGFKLRQSNKRTMNSDIGNSTINNNIPEETILTKNEQWNVFLSNMNSYDMVLLQTKIQLRRIKVGNYAVNKSHEIIITPSYIIRSFIQNFNHFHPWRDMFVLLDYFSPQGRLGIIDFAYTIRGYLEEFVKNR